jgi:hypothetical protein
MMLMVTSSVPVIFYAFFEEGEHEDDGGVDLR